MKTMSQCYRESMRFFAKLWRAYGAAADLTRAIVCRDRAQSCSEKEAR